MEFVITDTLQHAVKHNTHVDKVYWDGKGRYYFNVFELVAQKGDTTKQLYGTGLYSHSEVIAGKTNLDKLTEVVAKGDPDTLIVKTMTRKEVLAANPKPTDESLASKVINASAEEKGAILAALGLTPELLKKLNEKAEAIDTANAEKTNVNPNPNGDGKKGDNQIINSINL